jgi:hypothetical protein
MGDRPRTPHSHTGRRELPGASPIASMEYRLSLPAGVERSSGFVIKDLLGYSTGHLLVRRRGLGGAINAVAGGGSFVSFPALLFTGVAPVAANARNTLALWIGITASGGAYRKR